MEENSDKLQKFMVWLSKETFQLSEKIEIKKTPVNSHLGLFSTDDIDEGEILFEIPRSACLHPSVCSVASLLQREAEVLESKSGWVPLLISVMYESKNPSSRWQPYLDLFPSYDELDQPMFWEKNEMLKELALTGIIPHVERDLANITNEYQTVVLPFLYKHKDIFASAIEGGFPFFQKTVAFVMAYSFTEPQVEASEDSDDECEQPQFTGPTMVPLADALNHIAKHNAKLNFDNEVLRMVCVKPIRKGDEIFNTYGELSNSQLLHMYGFAELYPNNHYDTVSLEPQLLLDTYIKAVPTDIKNRKEFKKLLNRKKVFLDAQDLLSSSNTFIIGMEGVLTENELYFFLEILSSNKEEFEKLKENEDWMDNDVDLSFTSLTKLPSDWKELISRSCNSVLKNFENIHPNDDVKIADLQNLKRREKWSVMVRLGQKMLLKTTISHCS